MPNSEADGAARTGGTKPDPEAGVPAQTGRAGARLFCNQAEMMWLRTA